MKTLLIWFACIVVSIVLWEVGKHFGNPPNDTSQKVADGQHPEDHSHPPSTSPPPQASKNEARERMKTVPIAQEPIVAPKLRPWVPGATEEHPLIIPADGKVVTIDVNQMLRLYERGHYAFRGGLHDDTTSSQRNNLEPHSVIHMMFYDRYGNIIASTDFPLPAPDPNKPIPGRHYGIRPDLGIDNYIPGEFDTVKLNSIDKQDHKFVWDMVRSR